MGLVRVLAVCTAFSFVVGCGAQPAAKPAEQKKSVTAAPKQAKPATKQAKQTPKAKDKAAQVKAPVKKEAKEAAAQSAFAVVKEWDFTKLPKDQWEWYFPGNNPAASPKGAYYYLNKSGPGPHLRKAVIAADTITHVRVTMDLNLHVKDGKREAVPFKSLVLYFHNAIEKPKSEKWPFDKKCTTRLTPVAGAPGVYEGKLAGNADWKGTMQDFCIAIGVPELAPDQIEKKESYGCGVAKISFIKREAAPAAADKATPAAPAVPAAADKAAPVAPAAPAAEVKPAADAKNAESTMDAKKAETKKASAAPAPTKPAAKK